MDSGNHSSLTEFILTGLTEQPQFQLPIFPSLPKNLYGHHDGEPGHDHTHGVSSHLHTPVYYFLSNVYFIDLCQSTVITPKCWWALWEKKISSPTLNAWLSSTSFFFLLLQRVICLLKWHMTAMLPSLTPCFIMPSCLIIGASSSQQQFTSCESFNQHSMLALCWDSFSSRPVWLTIISVIFFHLWSHHVLAFISTNYWL